MRKNDEIQLGEINVFCLYVRREDVAIIARIEQDALAGNLYERREAPVFSHRSVLAERIVEDRDTVLRPGSWMATATSVHNRSVCYRMIPPTQSRERLPFPAKFRAPCTSLDRWTIRTIRSYGSGW